MNQNQFTGPELEMLADGLAYRQASCHTQTEDEAYMSEQLAAKLDKMIVAECAREQAETDLKRDLQSANLYTYLTTEPTPDMPKVQAALYLLNQPVDEEIGRIV